jgi:adhesin transport system membrane fusion protein
MSITTSRQVPLTPDEKRAAEYQKTKSFDMTNIEEDERRVVRWLLWSCMTLLILGIGWSASFKLDEVTVGQGKIIPSSREQVIQSLDAGILSQMNVREGDAVKQGDVLLRIDDSRSGSIYREAYEKWLALTAQTARLRAEAYGSDLTFPPELQIYPELTYRETQAFEARKQALDQELQAMTTSLGNIDEEIGLTAPLVKEGVMSQVELLRLRRQQSDLRGEIAQRRNRYLTDAHNELVRLESELSQTKENVRAREDAFRRSVVRAPMDGIVKNVSVTTIGGVIQAGQSILEIVPVQDDMLVEAYVKPEEVAYLKVGQQAVVKLTAYDFNKYGGFDGVIEHLSPDTLTDETQRQRRPDTDPINLEAGYYRIMVRITDAGREMKGMLLDPMPGMTAIVEIKTGEKTVLEYIIRPFQDIQQALRER